MTRLRVFLSRLAGLVRKGTLERDMDDELDFHLQMKIEFVVDVALEPSLANQTSKPRQEHTEPRHDDAPAGFTNRAMMPEIRSQFSASAASCFLPVRVMA